MADRRFPKNTFRGIGTAHIVIGSLVFLIALTYVIMSVVFWDDCPSFGCLASDDTIFDDEIVFVVYGVPCMIFGIMFIVVGGLSVCAGQTIYTHRQSGLKYGVLVMSCFCVFAGIGTACLGVIHAWMAGVAADEEEKYLAVIIMAGILALLGLVELILSIVGAVVVCCYSPVIDEREALLMPDRCHPVDPYPPHNHPGPYSHPHQHPYPQKSYNPNRF